MAHYNTPRIGIIGAGIAGLHLGLRLQQLGIDPTIIAEFTPEQVACSRLANAVVHWPTTLERERTLGIYHWRAEHAGFRWLRCVIHGPEPLEINSLAPAAARGLDYRIYLPRLMQDFINRGGRIEVSVPEMKDLGKLARRFDLLVIATKQHGLNRIFTRDAVRSPFDRPQRILTVGLFTGIRPAHPHRVEMSVAQGQGEAFEIPFTSRAGVVSALYIGALPGSDLAALRDLSYAADPAGFRATLLDSLERCHPAIYDRIDTARFDVLGPDDLLQGGVTPVVRHAVAEISDERYAIALGDAHVTVDPLLAQGANIGSYSAWMLAEAIAGARSFDLAFCRHADLQRRARVLAAAQWTNAFLQPPDDSRLELFAAMSQDRRLADEYIDNFNRPEWQWERVGTPDRIRAWLSEARAEQIVPLQA